MTGHAGEDPGRHPSPASSLSDPARTRALAESGLTAESDPRMEYFAQRVRASLDVPVALVSLVRPDQQVFPGMSGLPEPWATRRSAPLSHSFCRHVVATAAPVVIQDARRDPLARDSVPIAELGVVAYAGMPLTDTDGRVLGSLCAIDTTPRTWTRSELDALTDMARACSTELRLRLTTFLADRDRDRRDELEDMLRGALDRARLLLNASEAFTGTTDRADLRSRVAELLSTDLKPSYVGLTVVAPDGHLERVADPRFPAGVGYLPDHDRDAPRAAAARGERLVHFPDRAAFDAEFTGYVRLGLHALSFVPLRNHAHAAGVLVLGWDQPRALDTDERALVAAVAGYAGLALARADVLQSRIGVAHELQNAMLTELPHVPGLEMAARYVPADEREYVGGDWYDAVHVPSPGFPAGGQVLAVTVGDVTGHDMQAATIMGQVRAMLRQAGWEHPGSPPSRVLSALEAACAGVRLGATGTALLAHLQPDEGGLGRWTMTWTNAGHPPPILMRPDGDTVLLDGNDMLFGYPHLVSAPRRDHRVVLAPGSTLLLYTDGLVERRGADIDQGVDALRAALTGLHAASPREIVDTVVGALAGGVPADDVVAMAVRVPLAGDGPVGPGTTTAVR